MYKSRIGWCAARVRFLDDEEDQPHIERTILSGLEGAVSIRFMRSFTPDGPQWADSWPQEITVSGPISQSVQVVLNQEVERRPLAIELSISSKRFGTLELYFWIGDTQGFIGLSLSSLLPSSLDGGDLG